MTRDEKVAQLGAVWAFELVGDDGARSRAAAARWRATASARSPGWPASTNLAPGRGRAGRQRDPALPRRGDAAGIPAIIHEEMPPRPAGLGCAVLPAVDRRRRRPSIPSWSARWPTTIRRRMLATGARHALAPVLDIARDPRWGRIEETYGEDPYLAAELGVRLHPRAAGTRPADGVVATGKHMVGHGLAEGGLNQAPAHVGPRELRDEQLFPFEAAVRDAGLASDDAGLLRRGRRAVPCLARAADRRSCATSGASTASSSSDYIGIEMLATAHRLTDDLGDGGAAGAGAPASTSSCRGPSATASRSAARSRTGGSTRRSSTRAVARILRMKFRLGLFERPVRRAEPTDAQLGRRSADGGGARRPRAGATIDRPGRERRRPAARAGRRRRIAVIGPDRRQRPRPPRRLQPPRPHGDAARDARSGNAARRSRRRDVGRGRATSWPGGATILDAIRARLAGSEVVHAAGTGLRDGTRRGDRRGGRRVARGARRRDRRARRAVRPDRRLDDRRVPRSARPRASSAASRSSSRPSSRPGRRSSSSSSAAGRWRSSGPPSTAPRSCWRGSPAMPGRRPSPTSWPATSNPGGKLPIIDAAPRRPGPATYRHHPIGRPLEPEGRLRRRPDDAAVAVRVRAVVHDVRAVATCASTDDRADRRRRVVGQRRRRQHRRPGRRRGRPAVRPRRGGERRPAGPRAARLPAACTSRPASAGRSRSALSTEQFVLLGRRPAAASSSRAASACAVGTSSADLPLTATSRARRARSSSSSSGATT